MSKILSVITLDLLAIIAVATAAFAAGDADRGARDFRACAPCHALEVDRNMTGPSLAGVWNRKAGSLKSFDRYSPTLKSSGVVWNAESLDAWLKNPAQFIPQNRMTVPGIEDPQVRADLAAYLKTVSSSAAPQTAQQQGGMAGMMGNMGGDLPDLKNATPSEQVKSINYCRDTYRVTTADGETHDFWERNLRLKTDGSERGPPPDVPALVSAGMMGDRADIIFAKPDEITSFVKTDCRGER
jgi:cytochrome c